MSSISRNALIAILMLTASQAYPNSNCMNLSAEETYSCMGGVEKNITPRPTETQAVVFYKRFLKVEGSLSCEKTVYFFAVNEDGSYNSNPEPIYKCKYEF